MSLPDEASWKDRPRKVPPDRLPETDQELRDLLSPATSPFPVGFVQYLKLRQRLLRRGSKHHPASRVASARQRKMLHNFRQTIKPVKENKTEIIPPPKAALAKKRRRPSKQTISPPKAALAKKRQRSSEQNNTISPSQECVLYQEATKLNGLEVYGLGDAYAGRRINMNSLGIDIGTKNIVMAYRAGKKVGFLHEVNGFYVYPNPSKFVENMLDDAGKIRSDGTKRAARWIKFEGNPGIYVLGKDAEELAYAHNDTLLRPMAYGGIAQDEDAMMVLAAIVQGLLDMAENDIGKFDDQIKICYCTTAPSINRASNIDYLRQVISLIIDGYDSDSELLTDSIKESHAIVLKESPEGTGIGISWGAGTVTVSYVLWGQEIYSFSWVGAGDWIDLEVARRHGYEPEQTRSRSRETPTTVCRAKEKIDLSVDRTDRLGLDIALHYKILIQNVVRGIVQGFVENENRARIDKAIDVYMAGGTSCPNGFVNLARALFDEETVPFDIASVKRCKNPVFAVAEGCLMAAELQ